MKMRFGYLVLTSFFCTNTIFVSAQTTSAPLAVIKRLLGNEKSKTFSLTLNQDKQHDHFLLKTINNKVNIIANSEAALCSGVYFYLKHYCNSTLLVATKVLEKYKNEIQD